MLTIDGETFMEALHEHISVVVAARTGGGVAESAETDAARNGNLRWLRDGNRGTTVGVGMQSRDSAHPAERVHIPCNDLFLVGMQDYSYVFNNDSALPAAC